MLRVCAAFDSACSAEARGAHGWRGGITAFFAAITTISFCVAGYLAALGADHVNWSKCYDWDSRMQRERTRILGVAGPLCSFGMQHRLLRNKRK